MNLLSLISIPVSDEHRRKVMDAQFILKEGYVDFVWQERMKEQPCVNVKSTGVWPFRREVDNVVSICRVPGLWK